MGGKGGHFPEKTEAKVRRQENYMMSLGTPIIYI